MREIDGKKALDRALIISRLGAVKWERNMRVRAPGREPSMSKARRCHNAAKLHGQKKEKWWGFQECINVRQNCYNQVHGETDKVG